MSWESKENYSTIDTSTVTALVLKSATLNKSGQYLEKAGASGAICATKPYGIRAEPSNEFAIKAAHSFAAGAIKLGSVKTVDGVRYALASVHYENGADQEPVFSTTSSQIETTNDGTQRTFDVPAFAISPDEIAAMVASAGTVGGTGCELQKVTFDASCNVKPHTVNGDAVASDVTMGKATVAIEILQTSSTAPTLTAGSGWEISSPLTCTDPDSDLPTWTATLSTKLAYTATASN